MSEADELVFLPLGGSGEIGMNLNLYGFGPADDRQWIIVDCGVTFGDDTTPGVDLICPEPEYILDFKDDLQALFLTHAHEDHIGAVALMWPLLRCPIYATPFTAAMVRRKLDEAGILNAPLNVIDMGETVEAGPFSIEYVTLTHSIPEPNGLAIRTPLGLIFHTGDWKIDPDPLIGDETDAARLRALGDEGVLAMVCDSTNVLSAGEAGSEAAVRTSLTELVGQQTGRVAIASFASNVARVATACHAAKVHGRHVCLLGRSMHKIVEAARETGVLPADMAFVDAEDSGFIPKENILYLCTGSQGEPRAALSRIARNDNRDVSFTEGDTVIFSSRIIPGNERSIFDLQNRLTEMGVKVITEKDHFIHVSGHPCRDELTQMYDWIRPEIAVPVHGEARHIAEHAALAKSLQVPQAVKASNGSMIRLAPGRAEVVDEVPAGRRYLDGRYLAPDGDRALRDRKRLAYAGIVSLGVVVNDKNRLAAPVRAEIMGAPAGLDDEGDLEGLIEEAVEDALDSGAKKNMEDAALEQLARRAARNTLHRIWGKKPEVAVCLLRI